MRTAVAVLAWTLALAVPAGGESAPDESIGGVALGMTQAQLRSVPHPGVEVTVSPVTHHVVAVSTTQRAIVRALHRTHPSTACYSRVCVVIKRTRVTIALRWPSAL